MYNKAYYNIYTPGGAQAVSRRGFMTLFNRDKWLEMTFCYISESSSTSACIIYIALRDIVLFIIIIIHALKYGSIGVIRNVRSHYILYSIKNVLKKIAEPFSYTSLPISCITKTVYYGGEVGTASNQLYFISTHVTSECDFYVSTTC